MSRTISWGDLHNARDLGGLPAGGPLTQFGRFYRTPRLDDLAPEGWDALLGAGVRTIVDLRNADEIGPLPAHELLARHEHPIEDQGDLEFMSMWAGRLNSPAYYAESLDRWPDLIAGVFRRFAGAPTGGIVFHCSAGRDRTGLVAAMLLQLVGVDDVAIVEDYTLSVVAMNDHFARTQQPRERPRSGPELDEWVDQVQARLYEFLDAISTERFLLENGVSAADVAAIRARLLKP
jgi:hypothetical protein